jgi:hypothetical protein
MTDDNRDAALRLAEKADDLLLREPLLHARSPSGKRTLLRSLWHWLRGAPHTCPHDDADRLLVSGSKRRKWLSEGGAVPPEFSRREVLEVLRAYYASLETHQRVEVKLDGHSAR